MRLAPAMQMPNPATSNSRDSTCRFIDLSASHAMSRWMRDSRTGAFVGNRFLVLAETEQRGKQGQYDHA